MSKKTDYVKKGYASLDGSERQEIINFVNEFERASPEQKRLLNENLNSTILKSIGPRDSNICTCCGRSS
jgi:hypothetical protein